MFNLYSIFLYIIHRIYAIYLAFDTLWQWRQEQRTAAQPLVTPRHRLPKHLAVIFTASPNSSKESATSAIVQSVVNVVQWCRQLGITKLTVYEEHGILTECEREIRALLTPPQTDCEVSEPEVEYHPLTPPPSEHSESRPLSPSHSPSLIPVTTILVSSPCKEREPSNVGLRKRREGHENHVHNSLQLCLVSKNASKPAIATIATSLARNLVFKQRKGSRSGRQSSFTLRIDELESVLEGEDGLSSPDFMIVHSLDTETTSRRAPLELHAFPPWHIRLTEIFSSRIYKPFSFRRDSIPQALEESTFCQALDEYAGAEMRFGK